jgi:hypothetical protein
VAAVLAGGGVDRADPAQRGEPGLGGQPARIVADGDQQGAGDLGASLLAELGRARSTSSSSWVSSWSISFVNA